jgi:chemotaxis protein CheD
VLIASTKIGPGEYHVTDRDTVIVTVLGSCVSACIRDALLGVGGMNHFMLVTSALAGGDSARYGAYAMELLVNAILKRGGRRERLEAKVFGGGRVMAELANSDVGERNAAFVLDYLRTERIAVVAQDLLGAHPRKLQYFPRSGRARVRRLAVEQQHAVLRHERDYGSRLTRQRIGGDVELFA